MGREAFETESGLLTDYEGVVTDAWFAVDEKFGNTQLYLKQTTDSVAVPEVTERFSVGGTWKSFNGGKTVENTENPDKKKIHESSRYGQLLRRVFDELPEEAGDYLAEVKVDVDGEQRDGPLVAGIWVGTKWRWEQFAKDYTMKDDDGTVKSGTSKYNLPIAYLGAEGNVAAASSGTQSGGTSTLDALDLSDELKANLKAARDASASHGEFVDKAVGLTGVIGNDTLIKAIADETQLWKELS